MKSLTKSVAAATALAAALGIAYAQSAETTTPGSAQGTTTPDASTTQSGTMNQGGAAGTPQSDTAAPSGAAGTDTTTGATTDATADPAATEERAARADRN